MRSTNIQGPQGIRPFTILNFYNIKEVKAVVLGNHRVCVREILEIFNISFGSSQNIGYELRRRRAPVKTPEVFGKEMLGKEVQISVFT